MKSLTIEMATAIYEASIGSCKYADDNWLSMVRAELGQVIAARTANKAALVISWWHNDWSMVGDTAIDAAKRIRAAAQNMKVRRTRPHSSPGA